MEDASPPSAVPLSVAGGAEGEGIGGVGSGAGQHSHAQQRRSSGRRVQPSAK